MRKPKKAFVRVAEAAQLAGVTSETIRAWVKRGLLKAKRTKVVRVVERYEIERASIEGAREVTCRLCGKAFRAARPRKAQFCTPAHRDRWHYLKRKSARK